jgi:alkyldihydroxyacetonephosphate synthase
MRAGLMVAAAAGVAVGLMKKRFAPRAGFAKTLGNNLIGGAERFAGADLRHTPSLPHAEVSPEAAAPGVSTLDTEAESTHVWGFADTRFEMDPDGTVRLTGSRYALCGLPLRRLLPWVNATLQVTLRPDDAVPPAALPPVPHCHVHAEFAAALRKLLRTDQLSQDSTVRQRHGHGHTQEEMVAIKTTGLQRVPDWVVYPEDEAQVVALVALAQAHGACLIPYGGGTSVTEALRCPAQENRCIVSVDMQRLRRILWIDPVNRMACIEAGAKGRDIVKQLAEHGFTMGHEPDSIEFSSLGGWIATHASGMKKNRYGNIEDLVLDMRVVTAHGVLGRGPGASEVAPRQSVGIDPQRTLLGSEGTLGIVTSAVVKLFALPEVQRYGSVLFPTFEQGTAFLYELSQAGNLPASVRLMDNLQFQLGQALKPPSDGLAALKSRLEKLYVTRLKGFAAEEMTACTLVFEGLAAEVAAQETQVYRIAAAHGGMRAGAQNGQTGYQLTYGIAYIRDFVMKYHVIAESFETSVPWSRALELCDRVKRRIHAEHAARNLPGRPLVTCRISQLYDTGVCVYFYFAMYTKGVHEASAVYSEIEHAARTEILSCGGSLSHHHGVGKIRQRYLPEVLSPAALALTEHTKQAADPHNIFASGNLHGHGGHP